MTSHSMGIIAAFTALFGWFWCFWNYSLNERTKHHKRSTLISFYFTNSTGLKEAFK